MGGSSASSYLADPTSLIPSLCASTVVTVTHTYQAQKCCEQIFPPSSLQGHIHHTTSQAITELIGEDLQTQIFSQMLCLLHLYQLKRVKTALLIKGYKHSGPNSTFNLIISQDKEMSLTDGFHRLLPASFSSPRRQTDEAGSSR